MTRLPYGDRSEAGRVLAERLDRYRGRDDVVVLGLPRGGVEVAYEVAQALGVPLDVYLVRKLGAPDMPELAMGAIASGGVRVINRDIVEGLGVGSEVIDEVAAAEQVELDRRERLYRGDRPPLEKLVRGRIVILVDDGLATGATMSAAVQAIEQLSPAAIVCAVPVAAADVCEAMAAEVDEMVCAATPNPFTGVGRWYERFEATSDDRVRELLTRCD